jgi:polyphosphate kinase 1
MTNTLGNAKATQNRKQQFKGKNYQKKLDRFNRASNELRSKNNLNSNNEVAEEFEENKKDLRLETEKNVTTDDSKVTVDKDVIVKASEKINNQIISDLPREDIVIVSSNGNKNVDVESGDNIVSKDNEDYLEDKDEEIVDARENVDIHDVLDNATRDLSWLQFNNRILTLASDRSNIPLLEGFKFLAISGSNLDEFTTIRINRVTKLSNSIIRKISPEVELKTITNRVNEMLFQQNIAVDYMLKALFTETGYMLVRKKSELTDSEKDFVKDYFNDKIKSLLTPLVADNNRPFPLITNKSINIGVTIEDNRYGRNLFGTVQVPNLDRIIEIKSKEGNKKFILLEDLIRMNINKMFTGKNIINSCIYRVLRDMDILIEDDNTFIVDNMRETLKRREMGKIMRLDISGGKKELNKILMKAFRVSKKNINKTDGVIDLSFGFGIGNKLNIPDDVKARLSYPPFESQLSEDVVDEYNMFDKIDEEDILIHHPYETFDTVIDFIKQAAEDKNVVAIKQTLYRVSDDSKIMQSLINAAEDGKQVTVVLEAKARFDEANNLKWASALEKAGGHVIYGIDNYKVHCKMCLVVRKDKKGNLTNYVHIGTGNYNEVNAKIYTDLSLFTSRGSITNDIEKLFNALTGFGEPNLKKIIASPYNLVDSLIGMIDNEINMSKEGKAAKIFIKVNALTDERIIDKLYEAAQAGVLVYLVVRSAFTMDKHHPNIIQKAIIGRFLEHSRIYAFYNGGVYIGSCDLMERNLDKRVELLVPLNKEVNDKIDFIINTYKNDASHNSFFGNDSNGGDEIGTSAQEAFMKDAMSATNFENINKLYISK